MIRTEGSPLLHWNYFLAVEDDLDHLSRFVEFAEPNFSTYSIELTRILFAAGSEVDVVAKQLCKQMRPGCRAARINDYRNVLCAERPVIAETKVRLPRYGLILSPWSNWEGDDNPDWWKAYNDVKHHRHAKYPRANLRHALHAVAGLFVLLLFFYEREARDKELTPNPTLMRLGAPFGEESLFYDHDGALVYRLDARS